MPLIPIIHTLIVILIFIAIIAKQDAMIDFLPEWVITLLVLVFAASLTALPVVLLMHIWSV